VRRAAFGTRHGKLDAVREPLLDACVDCFLVDLDTDRFGTFVGTVPRRGTQRETAIAKAQASAALGGCDIGIASEGVFGPDPVIGLVAAGVELVVLIDERRRHPVEGRDATNATNFASAIVHNAAQAQAFAARVGVPSHGLLATVNGAPIVVTDPDTEPADLLDRHGHIRLETDMRAHRNPTRMAALRRAAIDLASNLQERCGACGRLGAANLVFVPGLRCSECSAPTARVASIHAQCSWCDAPMLLPPRHGLDSADPGECPRCNP